MNIENLNKIFRIMLVTGVVLLMVNGLLNLAGVDTKVTLIIFIAAAVLFTIGIIGIVFEAIFVPDEEEKFFVDEDGQDTDKE